MKDVDKSKQQLIREVEELRKEVSQRRRAEKALPQSEERFRLAVQGSSDGLWGWPDITKDAEWWSPRWYELLGYEDREVEASYSNFTAFLHPDDRETMKECVRAHFEERVPFDLEYRLRTKSGEYRWFRGRGQALWDEDGKPFRMTGSIRDITERKQGEENLPMSLEYLDTILLNLSVGVAILEGPEFRYFRINHVLADINGVSIEDHLGRPLAEVLPNAADDIIPRLREVLETGECTPNREFSTELPGEPNKTRHFIDSFFPIIGTDGKPKAVGAVVLDITERKQAEETLLLSRTRYQTLFNHSPVPLWEEDFSELYAYLEELKEKGVRDFRAYFDKNPAELSICTQKVEIMDVNQATLNLHHAKNKEELLGNLDKIFTEKYFDVFKEELIALAAGQLEFESESEVKTLTGEPRHIWLTLRIEKGEPGSIRAVLATVDITEQVLAQKKLKESEEKFSKAFYNHPTPMQITNAKTGERIDINESAIRLYGYSQEEIQKGREEILQGNLYAHSIAVDPEKQKRLLEKLLKVRLISNYPLDIITISGEIRNLLVSLSLLDIDDGNLVLAAFVDITERKQAEEQLKKNIEFEGFVSKIATKFIGLSGAAFGKAIQDSLVQIGRYFEVDTVRLYRLSIQGDVLEIRNMWRNENFAPPEEMPEIHKLKYPNLASHYSRGESVVFGSFDESPEWPEMRKILKFFGTKAGVGVPLEIDGSGVDVFAIDKVGSEHEWPKDIVEHCKTIGNVILSAILRRETEVELQDSYHQVKRLKDRLEQENIYLQEEIKSEHRFKEIIGNSNELQYTLHRVEEVAPTDATVLILGETGTGKDLIARAIHNASQRKERPLVIVNCATLPSNLIESELFGHVKGAFSGAHANRIGRFEYANGSSLFLDEIGELPIDLQAKLLRVLQDGEFERVGSSKSIKVDVRLIASTNRSLEEEMRKGRFRQDLYYRLNVIPITLLPLRERKADIVSLVEHFVQKYCRKHGKEIKKITRKTMDVLRGYHWPGNVRELENTIERAVITSPGPKLEVELPVISTELFEANETLEEIERVHISKILKKTGWKIAGAGGAAEILGMHSNTLRSRLEKLRIDKAEIQT